MTDKEIKILEQSTQKGDKKAAAQLNELGVDYQFGNNGQKVDLAQALHYYTIAAEGGNTNAMCNAAYCYATGTAGKVDAGKAFGLYQKAAEAGDLNGMTNLAGCYLNGFGTKQDAVEAIKWLVEALNAGAKNLQETLEQVLASLSPEDIKKFMQSGYNAAQYQMAEYCLKSKKSKDAILWYVQSYKSGNADAVTRMMTLAEDFRHRKNGQKENLPFAYQLYDAAAECRDIEARTKVAYCLYNGIGIEKDTKRAFALYEQLANEGNENGMANVGLIYSTGDGAEKDYEKAIYWLQKAMSIGDKCAAKALPTVYFEYAKSLGTEDPKGEGRKYLAMAAEKGEEGAVKTMNALAENEARNGDPDAAFKLGMKYEALGQLDTAKVWYTQAVANGHPQATQMLLILSNREQQEKMDQMRNEMQQQIELLQQQLKTQRNQVAESQRQAAEAQREAQRQAEEAKRQVAEAQRQAAEAQQRVSANRNPKIDVVITYDYVAHYSYYPDSTFYDQHERVSMYESEYLALKGNYNALCAHINGKYLGSNDSVLNARIERDD